MTVVSSSLGRRRAIVVSSAMILSVSNFGSTCNFGSTGMMLIVLSLTSCDGIGMLARMSMMRAASEN